MIEIPKAVIDAIRDVPEGRSEFFRLKRPRLYLAYRGRSRAYINVFKSLASYRNREMPISTQIVSLKRRKRS